MDYDLIRWNKPFSPPNCFCSCSFITAIKALAKSSFLLAPNHRKTLKTSWFNFPLLHFVFPFHPLPLPSFKIFPTPPPTTTTTVFFQTPQQEEALTPGSLEILWGHYQLSFIGMFLAYGRLVLLCLSKQKTNLSYKFFVDCSRSRARQKTRLYLSKTECLSSGYCVPLVGPWAISGAWTLKGGTP